MRYLISYDATDYDKLYKYLAEVKAIHVLESVWFVEFATSDTKKVLRAIQRRLDRDDGISVANLDTGEFIGVNLLDDKFEVS